MYLYGVGGGGWGEGGGGRWWGEGGGRGRGVCTRIAGKILHIPHVRSLIEGVFGHCNV